MVLFLVALVAQDTTTRSVLKTVDIATGQIQTVYSADRRFEAPNWSRDGRYFLINHEGRLYRLSVGGSQLAELPVELATPRINNDHGISPDGKSLVISHEPMDDWLTSSVYTLPIGGGTPKQITTKAPSFWHGWSPDGKTLAFVGRRDGEFDIYTIAVTGGDERRITTCTGLDDGPDYSPDGAFIYYNSFCSGKMEIWRMRPDGTETEQLTHDAYSNWFPHPSPDGRWMRKPVGVGVVRQLLGLGPIRPHAPDLHFAAAERVVIDEGAVGRIVRPVVEPCTGRDAALVAAGHRNGVDVELAVAAAHEGERLAVGRPAVPETRRLRRDLLGRPAADGKRID